MGFSLGTAEVGVDLNDKGLLAGLKNAERRVSETVKRIDAMRGDAEIGADISEAERKMDEVRKRIAELEHKRATVKVKADISEATREMAAARAQLRALDNEKATLKVEMSERSKLTSRVLRDITGRIRESRRGAEDVVSPFKKVSNALENMRLTVGPLSLSVRGFAVALLALSPIVQSLVGVAGGLAGVLGQGLIGGIGAGGAALTAFGLAFAGMAGVIASHRKELGFIKDEVKQLGQAWKQNTHIPESFGKAIKNSFGTLQSYIPMVGRESSKALDITSKALDNTRKRFEDPAVRKAVGGIFQDVQKSLPGLVNGLGNLGATWLLVTKSFSRAFPQITHGFDNWTQRQFKAAKNSKSLNKATDEMLASLGAVGDVAKSSGNLLLSFFTAAAPSGRKMLADVSALADKWSEWLSKPKNQKEVQKFLDESWNTTKKLASAIGDVVAGFKQLGDIARPAVDKVLGGLNGVTSVLNSLLGSGFGHGLIGALITGALLARVLTLTKGLAVFTGRALGINKILSAVNPFRNWKLPKISESISSKAPTIRAPSIAKPKAVEVEVRPVVKGEIHIPAGKRKPTVDVEPRVKGGDAAKIHIPSGTRKPTVDVEPKITAGSAGRVGRVLKGALTKENAGLALADALINPDLIGAAASEQLPKGITKGVFAVSRNGKVREALAATFNKLFTPPPGAEVKPKFTKDEATTGFMRDQLKSFDAADAKAKNLRATFNDLIKTSSGRKILLTFATSGDKRVSGTLRSLASTKLGRKILQVVEQGGPGALRALKTLAATKLGRKALQIIEQGGPNVQAKLNRLKATTLGRAIKRITESGGTSVQARINRIKAVTTLGNAVKQLTAIDNASAVINALRAIHDLGTAVKTITTVQRTLNLGSSGGQGGVGTGPKARGGYVGGFAMGGMSSSLGKTISQAIADRAAKNPPITAGGPGGKVNRPRYAVGEEPSSEFIIPTNPSYRGRARMLWLQAARGLGIPGFAQGKESAADKEKRLKPKDAAWIKSRHFRTKESVLGPSTKQARKIDTMEKNENRRERKYGIDADKHAVLNEDGTLNQGNLAWHKTQIATLTTEIQKVINEYAKMIRQFVHEIGIFGRYIKVLNAKTMLSNWGASKKKDLLNNYVSGRNEAREGKRNADDTIKDKRLDKYEWQQTAGGIAATKPDASGAAGSDGAGDAATAGPSRNEQLGLLSQAKLDLFRAFSGNLGPEGFGTGAAATGSFTGTGPLIANGGPGAPGGFGGPTAAEAAAMGLNGPVSGPGGLGADGRSGFTQINNFAAPPPDPHTFTKSLAHEAQTANPSASNPIPIPGQTQ